MIEKIAEVEGGLQEETTYDGRKLRWTEEARKGLWTMKNAYQRRRVKARVEKRARMKKLDAITLEFARQVIEEETGAPLDIQSACRPKRRTRSRPEARRERGAGAASEAKLIARDDRKNPLISTFDWTRRRRAADLPGPGRVHAEQDAGADRGACAGARRGGDRSCARRRGDRDRQADDGRDDRDLPVTGQGQTRHGHRYRGRPMPSDLPLRTPRAGPASRSSAAVEGERLPQRSELALEADRLSGARVGG